MKLPNFTRPLHGVGENNTKIIFLFLNLDTVLSDSSPQNFANICQIKWNWMRSRKFETVRIRFLSAVFRLLSPKNFVTMATWRHDFSSLLLDEAEYDLKNYADRGGCYRFFANNTIRVLHSFSYHTKVESNNLHVLFKKTCQPRSMLNSRLHLAEILHFAIVIRWVVFTCCFGYVFRHLVGFFFFANVYKFTSFCPAPPKQLG